MNNKLATMSVLLAGACFISACGNSKKAARTNNTDAKNKLDSVSVAIEKPDSVLVINDSTKLLPPSITDTLRSTETPPTTTSTPPKLAEEIEARRSLWSQYRDFNTFEGKAQMSYEANGESQDFSATFRVQKDQAIWVSISALGGIVNVARAMITPDSIKAILYLDKEYISIPTSEAIKLLPSKIEYSTLQNLIVGNPLIDVSTPADMTEAGNLLSFIFQEADKMQSLSFDKNEWILKRNILKATGQGKAQQMNVQLERQNKTDKFPEARNIQIQNDQQLINVTMDFKNYSFNVPVEMPFNIPKSYKAKTFQQ